MKKLLTFSLVLLASVLLFARDAYDIKPGATSETAPTSVEWENKNDAKLAAATTDETLAAFVADADSAAALLAQVKVAYCTDPLAARQIAAVSQWVMLPDPWYCILWDGEHAAGRKVWVKALLARAETATDDYVKVFCLDQLRWCGCDCSCVLERIRAIGAGGGKPVSEMSALVVRELEKKSVGLSGR